MSTKETPLERFIDSSIEHGIGLVDESGEAFDPFVDIETDDDQLITTVLAGAPDKENMLLMATSCLDKIQEGVRFYAIVMDGYVTVNGVKKDSLIIEIGDSVIPDSTLMIAQPYVGNQADGEPIVQHNSNQQCRCSSEDREAIISSEVLPVFSKGMADCGFDGIVINQPKTRHILHIIALCSAAYFLDNIYVQVICGILVLYGLLKIVAASPVLVLNEKEILIGPSKYDLFPHEIIEDILFFKDVSKSNKSHFGLRYKNGTNVAIHLVPGEYFAQGFKSISIEEIKNIVKDYALKNELKLIEDYDFQD